MAGTDNRDGNQDGKQEIKIYQRVYRLSALGGGKLDHLQTAIRQGSETLQRGYVVKKVRKQVMVEEKGFFSKKLVPKMVEEEIKQTLKFEERFQALNNLVQNYDAVIATLKEHQDEYQDFFENLADEIKVIVAQKCQEIASVEQERLEVERLAHHENDDDLLQITMQQKSELLETAKAIGYGVILMLKKLDLMSASLDKITNDQQTQREVLESMVKKLTGQKRAYEVQLKIKKLQADAVELTKIALNFESYMEKFMGSFQTLLGNVASVDQELSGAMKEIQQIAELAMGQQAASITMDDQSSQKVLNFLMASNLKKERLLDALEQAREANIEVDFDYRLQNDVAVTSLADCLENIQAYVQFELKPVLAAKEERQREELLLRQEQERQEREAAELKRQEQARIAQERQRQEQEAAELRRQQEIARQQEQARIAQERQRQEQEARAKAETERLEALKRLPSEKNIDYRELEKLLKTKQWYEADQLTFRLILKASGREEEGWFDLDSIKNFPCADLRTIDQLWVHHSDGLYGFSVQKQIYVECGGKLDFSDPSYETWEKFCDRTAWKSEGKWVNYPDQFFNKNLMSVKGHLPEYVKSLYVFITEVGVFYLFSHQDL
jgi:hypothetical protein